MGRSPSDSAGLRAPACAEQQQTQLLWETPATRATTPAATPRPRRHGRWAIGTGQQRLIWNRLSTHLVAKSPRTVTTRASRSRLSSAYPAYPRLCSPTSPRAVTARASRSRMRSGLGALSWRRRPAVAAPGAARSRRAAAGRQPPSRDRPARANGSSREIFGQNEVQQLVAERQRGGALRKGRRPAEVFWDLVEPGDR
jgi:hypothetical protein